MVGLSDEWWLEGSVGGLFFHAHKHDASVKKSTKTQIVWFVQALSEEIYILFHTFFSPWPVRLNAQSSCRSLRPGANLGRDPTKTSETALPMFLTMSVCVFVREWEKYCPTWDSRHSVKGMFAWTDHIGCQGSECLRRINWSTLDYPPPVLYQSRGWLHPKHTLRLASGEERRPKPWRAYETSNMSASLEGGDIQIIYCFKSISTASYDSQQ